MESLQLKKAIFYPTHIELLKKRGNITIYIEDINAIEYTKPNLWNYIWTAIGSGMYYPGYLSIYKKGSIWKAKSYTIKIKYKDIYKLPDIYKDKFLHYLFR